MNGILIRSFALVGRAFVFGFCLRVITVLFFVLPAALSSSVVPSRAA
jgi:hypothetical protein